MRIVFKNKNILDRIKQTIAIITRPELVQGIELTPKEWNEFCWAMKENQDMAVYENPTSWQWENTTIFLQHDPM